MPKFRRTLVACLVVVAACGAPKNGRPSLVPLPPPATLSNPPSTTAPPVRSTTVAPTIAPTTTTRVTVANPLGRVIDRVETAKPVVALTFDANLSDVMAARLDAKQVLSYSNDALLDTLTQLGVPATFFVAGRWAERYPTQLARIVANPSWELASSGYSYKSFAQRCPDLTELRLDEMAGDVTRGFDVLRPAGGRLVPYFRFPGLCADEQSIARVQPAQVTVVSGDVLSGDTSGASATTIANTVLAKVKPGSIVILNMTKVGAPNTEAALRRIVEGLAAKGLQPVAVSALLAGT